ncbi:IQ domain-containing protein H-like isoform X2 [Oopsacas minuta]|uniref:IQ domain-containing protein H-like isoform X2 n=1 Tax=Oopsacas minuta TaxID=111878 RepID=A0AAV7KDI4_9METZ|nr:IQ domain-containing protein H-like isoform X2 [Oopsacas minuta]
MLEGRAIRLSAGKRYSPPKLDQLDVDKGLLSLCERGLIPPGSRISLRNTPVRPKQVKLHPSTDQHVKPIIADVDQSAGQLALIKLAPESPQTAVHMKIRFNQSTNRNQGHQIFINYGTKKRASSSPPIKPGSRATPTKTQSHELVLSENLQLLYEFSSNLNKPMEQIELQESYLQLKLSHSDNWGNIVSLLQHLVGFLMKLGVTYAIIVAHEVVALAYKYPLEVRPSTKLLLECIGNRTDVVDEMKIVGMSYKVPGGMNRAATRIQSTWRMFVARRRYKQARQQKWAAGVICISWILRMRMVGIRKILANKRAGFVERSKNRNIQLGRIWEDFQHSPHTIVHLPSLGCHSSMRAGIRNLELRQNIQISRLFDLSSSSNSNILYISPVECKEEISDYYFNLMSMQYGTINKNRFQSLVPDHIVDFEYNKLSLSTVLNHSPRTLRRLKHLLQGQNAYLSTDIPSIDDFAVADYINVPILAATPDKLELFHNKSSCQRIIDTIDVDTPPHTSDIWSENALNSKLSDLIILNLDNTKWVFKMNHSIDAMGIAYCDVTELSCYEVLKRDRQRYAHNWEQRWAHESSQSKLLIELPSFLLKNVKLADRSLHSNAQEFFDNFFQYGGTIEAMPPVANYTALTINLFIAPTGTIELISSGDQILSSPFKVWGVSLPQTSVNPIDLQKLIQTISDTILTHEIIGPVNFDLITFFQGDKQVTWLTGIKLCPSNYVGLVKMLNCISDGHFDTKSGHYLCHIEENTVPKYAVLSNMLKHSNLALIRYSVLFQMFKAQGIVYKTDTKNGTVFGLIDDVNRRQIGMVVQSDSLEEALLTTSRNLRVIHQEISTVAMQGHNNFDDVIIQFHMLNIIYKILKGIDHFLPLSTRYIKLANTSMNALLLVTLVTYMVCCNASSSYIFTTSLSDITASVGDTIEFYCRLNTSPQNESLHKYIVWSIDGIISESDSTDGNFVIDSVTEEYNNSIVQCSFFSSHTSAAKLILIGRPDAPVLNIVTFTAKSVTINIDVGNTRGSPISEIRISFPNKVDNFSINPPSWSNFNYVIGGLKSGTYYGISVRCWNGFGWSQRTIIGVLTQMTVPTTTIYNENTAEPASHANCLLPRFYLLFLFIFALF